MRNLWDEIIATTEVIANLGIPALTKPLTEFNRTQENHIVKLSAQDAEISCELALRLALLSSLPTVGPPRARWLMCT